MDGEVFARGLAVGAAVAAFPGPVTMLTMRRVLERGAAAGYATGLGVATGDGIYAALGAFGVTAVVAFLTGHAVWLQLAGSLLLLGMGVRTLLSRPATEAARVGGAGWLGAFASAVGLTLSNPTTILSFAAIFAGLGLVGDIEGFAGAVLFTTGTVLGSAGWFVVLSTGTALVRRRMGPGLAHGIARSAGVVLLGFGGLGILDVARNLAA